jgi:hypothetical protein
LLLVAGAGVYFWVGNRNISDSNRVSEVKVKDDIVPGRDRAVLTLGDGRTIVLDDAGKGALAKQGEVNIVKLGEGQLAYDASAGSGGKKGEVLYNTISTPRGGQYQIVLPDGSRVWLNAASSIKFPAVFGDVRVVEMTGEVYMEVASGAAGGEKRMGSRKPFFIRTNGMEVQVLGTSFNVNAYKDEGVMRTTLVDGRVKILVGNGDGLLLGAGEQAEVKGGDVSLVKGVDVGKEVAWKNGYFEFSNTDIESVMRQLARWYDLEVRYEGKVNYMFSASIPRNVPIVKLLKALEMTGGVRFEMERKRVVVKGV